MQIVFCQPLHWVELPLIVFLIEEGNMTYKEFIQNIIDNRGQYGISNNEYYEMHHIIPRCLEGNGDTKERTFRKNSRHPNCIYLYPREHFVAHKLLAKEYPNNHNLVRAWWLMSHINGERYQLTSEEYEEARTKFVQTISGENNYFHTHKFYTWKDKHLSEETKLKISETRKQRYKEGRWTSYFEGKDHSGSNNGFYGKHHTDEFKRNHSQKMKDKGSWKGDRNPACHRNNYGGENFNAKAVICLNTLDVYNCCLDASRELNINYTSLCSCCNGKRKTAGKHPQTGEKLRWMFYNDYLLFICE